MTIYADGGPAAVAGDFNGTYCAAPGRGCDGNEPCWSTCPAGSACDFAEGDWGYCRDR